MKGEKPQRPLAVESEMSMVDLVQQFDWSKTELGDINSWDATLKTAVSICMHSQFPTLILWGDHLLKIYNDAYRKLIGDIHNEAFAKPAKEVWKEIWPVIGPMINGVMTEGKSFLRENQLFPLFRDGYEEKCFFTFSYSPIHNGSGIVVGVFVSANETTKIVNENTRLRILRNKQLENLFVQAPVAMCILKGPDLVVEIANEKMLEIWRKPAEAIINQPLFIGLPEVNIQEVQKLLHRVYVIGERVILDEFPITLNRKEKEEQVFVKFVYEPLRESDGSISGIMVLADEITEQVNNRRKIEESEERLRLAVESTKVGTWDFNVVAGKLDWSDECKRIYGYAKNEEVDFNFFIDHIFSGDKEFVEHEIQKALEPKGKGLYDITHRITLFNSKKIRWIRAKGRVFFNHGGDPQRFIGTTIDITDQKTLEENLRDSEMRLRLAIEASKLGTFNLDLKNLKIEYSERFAQMLGLNSAGTTDVKDFVDRIHPEDMIVREKAHALALENGTLSYEARFFWPDKSVHWLQFNGTVVHDEFGKPSKIYGTSFDTTDQKTISEKLEKEVVERTSNLHERNLALKRSEERYHRMIDEVQDYAIILLDKNGIIQNWNKGAEKIKAYTEKEIIGKHFSIFYLPEDQERNLPQNLINRAIQTGRAVQEGWRKRKDGTRFWGSITITALHDERNNIIGFSKVTRDLTEKKIAEDKLLEYTAELESQNKELEQFAYVASHDLQEPLRKIQTFAEIIQKNIKDENTVKTYFDKINSAAQRMSELIRSVLNYSKLAKDGVEMVDVDLNSVINNVIQDFELLIADKHAVINCDKLPVIKGIPLQLGQLFANLISNGLKFSIKDPVINITSRVVDKNEVTTFPNFLSDRKYVEISIKDNGIGFDQQYEKLIFTMFQRLHGKQHYAGTGIGLALCKKIVENHNGFISAKSELGKGATFYVYLPC
jgi:PAS domain S-box-containing protein